MSRRAAIALGANLGDPAATFERALGLIGREIAPVVARSGWRSTPALVHPDDPVREHPPYLNGVILVDTALAPDELLRRLHAIERSLGRDRSAEALPWQPRTLDLDLVALGQIVRAGPDPVLPHPRMHQRDFVVGPLAEIWPDWRHPRLGRTAAELAAALHGDEQGPA
jgi:2-amino-4-hydroxy-6-hydroxymethyldihydropteridine diphosphokinase